jgi:hypothetical protein
LISRELPIIAMNIERNMLQHRPGYCIFCGRTTLFLCFDKQKLRNDMLCPICKSFSRKRHVAKILCQLLKKNSIREIATNSSIEIYNTDIGDSFDKALCKNKHFFNSAFFPNLSIGSKLGERSFCQDLQQLTFPDNSFDIVISEDVLEHIRHYEKALKEIWRVLKHGGIHVFTVPIDMNNSTITRIDTTGDKDIFLYPPEYHGDSLRSGGILAYRTFGKDLPEILKPFGFKVELHKSKTSDAEYGIYDSIVVIARKTINK